MKLVHGVGINDSTYLVTQMVEGRQVICPYYNRWKAMLERCYSNKSLLKYPTYIGCTVDISWKKFTTFRLWMEKQNWKGMHLDKDILIQGNKVYSEATCLFVSPAINGLLCCTTIHTGDYPTGVHLHKKNDTYRAMLNKSGTRVHLGLYNTPVEAHLAYIKAKQEYVYEIAKQQAEPLKSALLAYKVPVRF